MNERLYDMFSDILFIQHNPYVLNENTPWIVSKEPIRQERSIIFFKVGMRLFMIGNQID